MFVVMRFITVVLLCRVIVCVKSDCGPHDCEDEIIKPISNEDVTTESVRDLKLDVPEFKPAKDVEIKDVNAIIYTLSKLFEQKLNDSNLIFKNINNKTKIIVKSFDFNVDFENGNAHVDMDLSKEEELKPNNTILVKVISLDNSRTVSTSSAIENITDKITEAIGYSVNAMIESKKNLKIDDIYNTIDFDTTYYDENEDNNSTDYPIIDYIELYKDHTVEQRLYTGTEEPTTLAEVADQKNDSQEVSFESLLNSTSDLTDAVFPWVVTIFIKNSTGSSQFHYFCDGALLSEKVILTGGRCVQHASGLTAPENILVFLGKTNLKTMGGKERLHRIKKVVLHQNYTVDDAGRASHDLAILVMELPAELNERIQSACVDVDTTTESQAAVTTAWGPNGQLLPVFFEKEQSEICLNQNENVFCASYSSKIPLCPSYGGVYATKRMSKWCVQGIFYGDPANKGVCFNNNVLFTSLRNYMVWIDDFIVIHSDIL